MIEHKILYDLLEDIELHSRKTKDLLVKLSNDDTKLDSKAKQRLIKLESKLLKTSKKLNETYLNIYKIWSKYE